MRQQAGAVAAVMQVNLCLQRAGLAGAEVSSACSAGAVPLGPH